MSKVSSASTNMLRGRAWAGASTPQHASIKEWVLRTRKDRLLLQQVCGLCRWKDALKDTLADWSSQAWSELLYC